MKGILEFDTLLVLYTLGNIYSQFSTLQGHHSEAACCLAMVTMLFSILYRLGSLLVVNRIIV